jgi:redox-sensitive bicupin YhaK (pirin superfamily)
VSTSATTILHGVQLWVALPDSARDTTRGFDHYAPPSVTFSGAALTVFLGSLAGTTSPVHTHTPLLGAQIDLAVGASVELEIDPAFEHGLIVDRGAVEMSGAAVQVDEMAYQGPGAPTLSLTNTGGGPVRAVLLGGEPFAEELVMWWNFVGRSHEDIVEYREQWQQHSQRFGTVLGYQGSPQWLPAPPLPMARLKPRRSPGGKDMP